jgi:hypothetical protein
MLLSFGVAAAGGLALILVRGELLILNATFVTRFGINCAFSLCYIITAEYFPPIVCSRVFGICNIFARVSTILSPLIAELDAPVPMATYVFICMVLMVASTCLRKNE